MFIGHLAVGFASKRVTPKASLGVLMAAPMALDLLWPLFLLAGWEQVRIDPGNTAFTPLDFVSYPYTHSLAMSVVWAALFALIYWAVTRYTAGAFVIAAGVVSHWILDYVTHRPDLPLYPGGTERLGLELWNSVAGTIAIESVMFAAAVWIYVSSTRARDRIGSYGFWAFVVFMLITYFGNAFGSPPPSAALVARLGLAIWLIPLWAWWFDRHREARITAP
jgi:membrane-bound metal-dependent hydrolase YbcI (DUF457 family)